MTYDEALEYIHGVSSAFCKPGLERIKQLTEALGSPERKLRFIHIGGTNGKGSTSSMLASVLMAAGYKVGLYTSPYILEFGERIRINGENIPKERLTELTERVKPIAEAMEDKPTEFELITAIAFLYYASEAVDVVVLEVGLGGRLDSTNIIESPLCSVITGISLDHTAILGDTVEKIAFEKAGIIKSGCPVLYGGRDEAAGAVIRARAEELGSPYLEVDHSALSIIGTSLSGTEFSYKKHSNVKISLLGEYQPRNAATVLECVDILRSRGISIPDEAIQRGLCSARWSARFEIISKEPLIIFDGAHNPEGIEAASASIETYFPSQPVYILSGVLRDKDYTRIAATLARVAKRVYTMTPDNPRALCAEEYASVISSLGVEAVPSSSIGEALSLAYRDAKRDAVPLICLGSLYTYVDVINSLKKSEE